MISHFQSMFKVLFNKNELIEYQVDKVDKSMKCWMWLIFSHNRGTYNLKICTHYSKMIKNINTSYCLKYSTYIVRDQCSQSNIQ